MANRAFLFVSNSDVVNTEECDVKDDVLAVASYCIPLFWFSLFSINDIVYSDVGMDDGSTEKVPKLVVGTAMGRERATERKANFLKLIPRKYESIYEKWLKLLNEVNESYLHVDLAEIWIMESDSNIFEANIRSALSAVESGNKQNLNVLLDKFVGMKIQTGLLFNKIIHPNSEDEIICMLCGYSWFRKVSWES